MAPFLFRKILFSLVNKLNPTIMKKLLLPICILLAGVVTANAQSFSIGARAGLNFATEKVSSSFGSISPNNRTSILLGGYAKIMFTEKMGIQPELFYSGLGATESDPTAGTTTTKTNYLSIPVFFRYNIVPQFHLLAGPQLGILLSAKQSDNSGTTDIKDQLNSSDFGGTIGAGVDFGPFNGGLRYNFGFSNIAKNTSGGYTVKNSVVQLVVGFKLFGK
jgi:hypothetical protein